MCFEEIVLSSPSFITYNMKHKLYNTKRNMQKIEHHFQFEFKIE